MSIKRPKKSAKSGRLIFAGLLVNPSISQARIAASLGIREKTEVPILFGETDSLHVRVDVDEIKASRLLPGLAAVAHPKGDATRKIPLEFVRIDPYIVPKKSLTGANTERVDVRVFQIIYKFWPPDFRVYPGQQVDVFIDAAR